MAADAAIFLARMGKEKKDIKGYIESKYGYDLSKTLDDIHPAYRFSESCQDTVPQAIIAFLESMDFEDAIRNAVSIEGDSGTLAAITEAIAEAAYGVRSSITTNAFYFLDDKLSTVINAWLDKGLPLGAQTKKTDWKPEDFSKAHVIHGDIRFGETQLARVRMGLRPEAMEDKWFAYCEGNKLCFHRSWTGYKIYEAEIQGFEQSYRITDIKVERDDELYSNTDDALDFRTFNFLFARGLLGLDADIPTADSGEVGVMQAWSSFGRMIT